jgi:hypothetical protein
MTAWLLNKRLENFPLKNMKDRRGKTLDQEIIKWVLLPCMDYLHGDVADDQFRAACHYEYARESTILRKAAQLLKATDAGEIASQIECEFHCGSWFFQPEWGFIWQCPSFPAKSWNQLTDTERVDLLCGLPLSTTKIRPLLLGEVMFLRRYLDQLKEMADQARTELKEAVAAGRPRQKVYPILELEYTPFVQALLPLDFSKSKKRLLGEIGKWLDLPENKARFEKHKRRTEAGTQKQAKDRLKDLAAWRLYRELGCDAALRFTKENRKRDKSGRARPFHDPRQDQSRRVPINEAALYSEESGFLKAKARALKYRAKLIPWEFGQDAKETATFRKDMIEWFKDALKQAQKISNSSS